MIRKLVFLNMTKCRQYTSTITRYSSTSLDIEKLEQDTSVEVIDDEEKVKRQELEKMRNKSRLAPRHYNILHGKPPYKEPVHWSHHTLRYKRKLYGKYGSESGVDASLCWPTKEELADMKEYERVEFPHSIPEMIEKARKKRQEKEERILKRQEDISQKVLKLDAWIAELNSKIAKKEEEAREAKERKEKLIEEVRRHFGYTVDPRDDRFKEMLEKKEKEQKKAMKEARRKAKEEKVITRILSKKEEKTESSKKIENE